MTKFFAWLLGVELVVGGLAPVIFKTISDRFVAGMVAGAIFVALGVFLVVLGLQSKGFRRTASFWAGCLHLFASALPLLITRIVNYSRGFEDVLVLGLPGPVFHRVSTTIFTILLVATSIDLVRAWRASSRPS